MCPSKTVVCQLETATSTSSNESHTVDDLYASLLALNWTEYLKDKDTQNALIAWLSQELRQPPIVVRLVIKPVFHLLVIPASQVVQEQAKLTTLAWLKQFPWAATLLSKLKDFFALNDKSKKETLQAESLKETMAITVRDELQSLQELLAKLDRDRQLDSTIIQALRCDFQSLLSPQPNLISKRRSVSPNSKTYYFSTGELGFWGRDNELEQLRHFIDTPAKLSWWLLTGAGGLGKSRLAFELCQSPLTAQYRSGFLASGETSLPDRWTPSEPTLIIVDYALSAPWIIKKLVEYYEVSSSWDHPVRILFIERDQALFNTLMPSGREGDRLAWKALQYQEEALNLKPMTDDNLVKVMQDVFKRNQANFPVNPASILEQLHRIDPKVSRPLFAIYLAEAFSDNSSNVQVSRESLLNHILDREQARWNDILQNRTPQPTLRQRYENLIFLTTLSGGCLKESVKNKNMALWQNCLPGSEYSHSLYGQLLDVIPDKERIPAIEPDILGEWYLWRKMQQVLEQGTDAEIENLEALCQLAWQLPESVIFYVLYRMQTDFQDNINIQNWIQRVFSDPQKIPSNDSIAIKKFATAWCHLSTINDETLKRKAIHALEALPQNDPVVIKQLAGAWRNLSALDNEAVKREAIQALEAFPQDDLAVIEELAWAWSNLSGVDNEIVKREALRVLENLHQKYSSVIEQLATAWLNLSSGTSEAVIREAIQALKAFPQDNPTVIKKLAGAWFNLTIRDNEAIIREAIQALEALPQNPPVLSEELAGAWRHLSMIANETVKREAIQALKLLHQKDSAVIMQLAWAWRNLSVIDNEVVKREAIQALELLHQNDSAVIEQLAWAWCNLSSIDNEAVKREAIQALEALSQDNPTVIEQLAGAWLNLSAGASEAVKREAVNVLEAFPRDNSTIVKFLAGAWRNLSTIDNKMLKREAFQALETLPQIPFVIEQLALVRDNLSAIDDKA